MGATAAIRECHKLGGLHGGSLSAGFVSEIRVWGHAPSTGAWEGSVPGLSLASGNFLVRGSITPVFSLCS